MNNKLHHIIDIYHQWRGKYHVDDTGAIVFQNAETMANVRFTNRSLHDTQNSANAFEHIPDTIESPDEIWSLWADPKTQRIVNRVYIKGDVAVMTTDGIVKAAFSGNVKKYRKGVLL